MLLNLNRFKKSILGAILLIFIITINSCVANKVYGLKKEDFLSKVSRKDYGFIFDVDYLKNSIKEINRLGDGASYYMSFVYKKNNMLLFSNKLLYQEIQNKNSYYGPKAAAQLLKQLLAEKDFVKAEAHALEFLENYKGIFPEINKQLIEAIYWQKKDSQVVPFIDNLDRSLYSDYANYELDMLKTVSSARLGIPTWQNEFKDLFFNQPLSPILARAYSFIDFYPEYGEGFTKNEKEFFKAMSLASSGNYTLSQEILRYLMLNSDWIFKTEQAVKNISKIIKESRYISLNLDSFNYAKDEAVGDAKDEALVSYASLFFNIENFSSVINILEDNISNLKLGKTKDDAIWLYLLSLSHVDRERIVSSLNNYLDKLTDNAYASDIIDHVITALVQNKEWEYIKDVEGVVGKFGSKTDQSRISWILSRLYYHDYLDTKNKSRSIEGELDDIVTMDNSSYYSYLANALLKRESNIILSKPGEKLDLNSDDLWIEGFLKYGLEDEALNFSRAVQNLNYTVCIEVGKLLDSEGKHLETLRFLSRMDIPLNSESFPLYYPLPYKSKIIEISNKYNFPSTLFSGLIRTESGFDMDVVSSAGAIGLSQLMPSTAYEQAGDIGLEDPDLNDPNTNILLGGTYLDWLIDRFYTLPLSAMAYNAGPGNVKKWQRLWGDLPDELFIEASPFKETRNYVPKILKAAIYYGHEEYSVSPYEVVKQFFPDID